MGKYLEKKLCLIKKIPADYKQTEIGVIPKDWDLKKLGDCLIRPPRYGIGAAAVDYANRLPKYIRITDISETGLFLPKKTVSVDNPFSANYFLSEGDLVVARTGASVGKSYLYRPKDGPLVFAGFLICLSPQKNTLHPQYLSNYCKSKAYWNWVKLTSMRSGQPGINGNEYARLLIPLPKIPEQIAIAKVLSDTDALIEHLEKLITKKKDIKRGTMQQLLTGKKRLPGFSGEWRVNTIKELEKEEMIKLSRGKVISKKDIVQNPGNNPIYSSSVHNNGEFGRYGEFMFDEELITWSVDGGGHFFYRPKHKFSVTNVCGFMRINEKRISYKFLALQLQLLHSRLFFDYTMKAHPSVIRKIYKVAIPIIEEQTAIATILSDMDAEIERLEQKRNKYIMLKQGMMQQLLTGRIRIYANN